LGFLHEVGLPSLKENGVFLVACGIATLVFRFSLGWETISTFGLIMLVVSAGLMLTGGAMDLATSASGRKLSSVLARRIGRTDAEPTREQFQGTVNRAATFAITGVLLFAESLLLAAVFV